MTGPLGDLPGGCQVLMRTPPTQNPVILAAFPQMACWESPGPHHVWGVANRAHDTVMSTALHSLQWKDGKQDWRSKDLRSEVEGF